MGDIEMTPTDAGISLHIKLDKLASATMEALESLSIKMDVIQAGLALRLPKEKLEEFVVVRKILRKAAGQRATVVHACWGVTDAKPDDLILMGYRGENTAYTVQDFKDIAVRIDAAKLELMKFAESCHFALGKVPPPERP